MNNLEKIMRYGCALLITWPILFILKGTLFWIIWNLTYSFIPVIHEPISWFGSICVCLLFQVLRIGLSVNFSNKN